MTGLFRNTAMVLTLASMTLLTAGCPPEHDTKDHDHKDGDDHKKDKDKDKDKDKK